MSIHLQRDLENVRSRLLLLSAEVEDTLFDAVKAFTEGKVDLAREVVNRDDEIDRMEVEIEEECLKILALHQPVAIDLRYLVAILKINNDLERVGDLASHIAQRTLELGDRLPGIAPLHLLPTMNKVKQMLHDTIEALIHLDQDKSRQVCSMDNEVDDFHRQAFQKIAVGLQKEPANFRLYMGYLSVSRYLERIADLATNIAEDVVYLITGTIIRHSGGEFFRK